MPERRHNERLRPPRGAEVPTLAKTVTIKPEEAVARSYADRLILRRLTEMEGAMKLGELAEKLSDEGLGLAAVRSLLATNPERFAYHERRWVPAARIAGQGRSFSETVRLLVDRFGGPMPIELIVQEIARIRRRDSEGLQGTLERVIRADQELILTPAGEVALATWAFMATDETIGRAFDLYGVKPEEVEAAQAKLKDVDFRAPDAAEKALKAAAPIDVKVLGAVAWLNMNSQDPRAVLIYDGREFFAQILSVEGYVYGADGMIHPADDAKKWISTATKVADKLAPTIEVEDAAPIEVKVQDVVKMVERIVAKDQTITGAKLLEEFYEITPGTKTYVDDLANLATALREQPEVWWVGGDRFRKVNSAPDFIFTVPEPFQYVQTENRDEDGELVDVELTDEGLSSSLRKLLTHPLAMDVLDEDIGPAPKTMPERARLVLKSVHRELGTFPMAQIPTGWFDADPAIQELIFIDPSGRELQVWMNHDARLLYNLIDWWYEQPVESGSVFTLTKTAKPNVLEFEWDEQTDPVIYISSQRMEELRDLQARSEGMSTLEVLIDVMSHWPKGADYLTVLAEVNVVRRTTRRLVASLLSSYQCFYQRSGSPVWHFDAKKVELGFDKTKRKFVKK
jgi:hypothetical protein